MKQMRKPKNLILTLSFLAIILFLSATNATWFATVVKSEIQGIDFSNVKSHTNNGEVTFRKYFHYKGPLVDVCGLSFLAMNKKMVGNFEFVKDDHDTMQLVEGKWNILHASESIMMMSDRFARRDIPLVYVVMPPRFAGAEFPLSQQVDFYGSRNSELIRALDEAGVETLEIDANVAGLGAGIGTGDTEFDAEIDGEHGISRDAFKTDIHLKTEAEFRSARQISASLMEMGLRYNKFEQIYDASAYTIEAHPFKGNLSESSGRFFTHGIDQFELYYPDFPTDFSLINTSDEIEKNGDFRAVLMNGMEDELEENPMPYWVLNYMQYPSPYYTITNHNAPDACRLLVIMDSYAMRTTAFLALGAAEVTVIDPRGEGGNEILKQALEEGDYDAVIVAAGGNNFYDAIALE